MKKLNLPCLAAAVLLAAGCAKDGKETIADTGEKGFLTVKIASENSTRAILDGTTNTDAVITAFENNVRGFSAYVFNWNTGDLEGKATSADGTPATITGLNTATPKRVVVIANGVRTDLPQSFIPQFEVDPNYSRMDEGYLSLLNQSFTDFTATDKAFLMTGENPTPAQLVVDENTLTIPVKRVVAKVQLGDISFDPSMQLTDIAKFSLTEAMIQRAAIYSTLGTGAITTPTTPAPGYVGGAVGTVSTVSNPTMAAALTSTLDFATYLDNMFIALGYTGTSDPQIAIDDKTLGDRMSDQSVASIAPCQSKAFFYVLPNNSASYSLLTLKGAYDGVDYFYPIEINDADAEGSTVSRDFIKRNTIYTLNVKFKSSLAGTTDPDIPGEVAQLEVTVQVANWEGPITQDVEW